MIKAEELRIGNWVMGRSEWVDGILPGKDVPATISSIQGISRYRPNTEEHGIRQGLASMLIAAEKINPISLTSEILEKAGFEVSGSKVHAVLRFRHTDTSLTEKEYSLILFDEFRNGVFVYQTGSLTSIRIPIHYVHQLQNLYFSLTGTELNIEL